jgi:hypothetical protein
MRQRQRLHVSKTSVVTNCKKVPRWSRQRQWPTADRWQ